MRRLQIMSLALIVLLASSIAAQAQTKIPEKLSLTDAVALALHENVQLKAVGEGQRSSVSRLKIAQLKTSYTAGSRLNLRNTSEESGLSSLIYTDLNYENHLGTTAIVELSPLGIGTEHGGLGFVLRQPLTKGKGDLSPKGSAILSAKSDVVVRDYDLYQSKQSTVMEVIQSYYDAVLARERVKVQESAVQLAQELATATLKREEAGLMTGIQVSRADINVAKTKNALNIQRASARGALDRVMLSIGFGVGQTPELIDMVPDTVPEVPALEEAIARALESRTELKAYDQRISNQTRDFAMRKDAFRPGLNAVASFNSTNSDTGLLSPSIFSIGTAVVGMELSIPFDQRVIRENRDISERALQIMQEQRTYQMERITQEVRSAYRGYEAAKISLEIYGQNMAVAKDGLHIAQRMVEEGEGDNREVLDAQQSLTDVQVGLLSAKSDLYIACIHLKLAMGEDLTKMGSK